MLEYKWTSILRGGNIIIEFDAKAACRLVRIYILGSDQGFGFVPRIGYSYICMNTYYLYPISISVLTIISDFRLSSPPPSPQCGHYYYTSDDY